GRELPLPALPDASPAASSEVSPPASPEASRNATPEPAGPRPAAPGEGAGAFLARLEAMIRDRRRRRPAGSYTTALFAAGLPRILQKVGEEAVETVVAGGQQEPARLVEEAADLVYHLTVLLVALDVSWNDVMAELRRRSHPAG
ncbi:MAG TPA: phosphoribosyl-ATP diphosphatase, partial [Thermaerobacter sp.]